MEGNAFKCMGVQGESPGVEARLKTEPKMITDLHWCPGGEGLSEGPLDEFGNLRGVVTPEVVQLHGIVRVDRPQRPYQAAHGCPLRVLFNSSSTTGATIWLAAITIRKKNANQKVTREYPIDRDRELIEVGRMAATFDGKNLYYRGPGTFAVAQRLHQANREKAMRHVKQKLVDGEKKSSQQTLEYCLL